MNDGTLLFCGNCLPACSYLAANENMWSSPLPINVFLFIYYRGCIWALIMELLMCSSIPYSTVFSNLLLCLCPEIILWFIYLITYFYILRPFKPWHASCVMTVGCQPYLKHQLLVDCNTSVVSTLYYFPCFIVKETSWSLILSGRRHKGG